MGERGAGLSLQMLACRDEGQECLFRGSDNHQKGLHGASEFDGLGIQRHSPGKYTGRLA